MWSKFFCYIQRRRIWLLLIVLAMTSSFLFAQHSSIVKQLWASVINSDNPEPSFFENHESSAGSPLIKPHVDNANLTDVGENGTAPAGAQGDAEVRENDKDAIPSPLRKQSSPTAFSEKKEEPQKKAAEADSSDGDGRNSESRSWISAYRSGTLRIPAYRTPKCSATPGHGRPDAEHPASIDQRSPEYISSMLSLYNEELQEHYRQELKINPNLNGYVEVRFIVATDGKVKNVTLLEWTLQSEKVVQHVVDCVCTLEGIAPCDSTVGEKTYRQRFTFGLSNK